MNFKRWLALFAVPGAMAVAPLALAVSATATVGGFTVDLADLDPADGIVPAISFHDESAFQFFMFTDPIIMFDATSVSGYNSQHRWQRLGFASTENGPTLARFSIRSHTWATDIEAQASSVLSFELSPHTAATFHLPYTMDVVMAPRDMALAESYMTIGFTGERGDFLREQFWGPTGSKTGELTATLTSGADSATGTFGFGTRGEIVAVPEAPGVAMWVAGLALLGAVQRRQRCRP